MLRGEYIEDIKTSLGYPVVEIELDDSIIGNLVDKAFRETKSYITESRFVTIPYSTKAIDVSAYNISAVVQIFRTVNPAGFNNLTDVFSFGVTGPLSTTSPANLLMSDYIYRTQVTQIKSTITTDLDFTYDKEDQKLYINTYNPRPDRVTLVYIPDFKNVDEIKEQYWVNYIMRLALAYTKISVGRVRSKYNLSSSLYELDGGSLIQEGLAERDQVREELAENSDIAYPMD